MSRVLINGQDVNMTDGFPEMNYDEWKALPKELRPDFTIIKDRNYTGEPLDISVSVTADGVKTYSQCLDALYALIDRNKITRNAILKIDVGTTIFYGSLAVDIVSTGVLLFYNTNSSTLNFSNSVNVKLTSSGSIYQGCRAQGSSPYNVFSDYSSDVPASGTVFTLYYNIVSSGGVEPDIFYKDVAIAGTVISNYWAHISSGISASDYTAIGFAEGGIWDEKIYLSVGRENALNIKSQTASYTIPSNRTPIRMFFVKNNTVNATPLA